MRTEYPVRTCVNVEQHFRLLYGCCFLSRNLQTVNNAGILPLFVPQLHIQ